MKRELGVPLVLALEFAVLLAGFLTDFCQTNKQKKKDFLIIFDNAGLLLPDRTFIAWNEKMRSILVVSDQPDPFRAIQACFVSDYVVESASTKEEALAMVG